MVTTLEHLLRHHDERRAKAGLSSSPSRGIVWSHNSHAGDSRATELSRAREWNVGQLVREKWGLQQSFNIGFTTYDGSVSAARRWGGHRETMTLNPALPGSYEDLMHAVAIAARQREEGKEEKSDDDAVRDFALVMRSNGPMAVDRAAVRALEPRRLGARSGRPIRQAQGEAEPFHRVLSALAVRLRDSRRPHAGSGQTATPPAVVSCSPRCLRLSSRTCCAAAVVCNRKPL